MESQSQTVALGDVTVGRIAYGCWRFAGNTPAQGQKLIETALGHHMTLIDTADIYGFGEPAGFGGAEAVLGEILASSPSLRHEMVLATKGGITPPTPYDSSDTYLTKACEASLKRLNTDVIDLYQIHRPDLLTSFEGLAETLGRLVESGKIKSVGVSNFTTSQFRALQAHLNAPIISHQPEFSVLCQDPITNGVLDQCQETGAACLAWSPLAGGALATGQGSEHPEFRAIMSTIDRLAEEKNASRTQIALAFCLKHPGKVVPIIGTQSIDRIAEAAGAVNISLSSRDWYDLVEANRGVPMP